MKEISSIEERAIVLAQYIIDSKDTVRGAAKKFGVSKSTVHKNIGACISASAYILGLFPHYNHIRIDMVFCRNRIGIIETIWASLLDQNFFLATLNEITRNRKSCC